MKVAQALSSDQPLDPIIAPTADLRPLLEEQRRDIDRIIANENVLQQGMTSLRTLVENTRLQASHGFLGDINITADNITKVSSRLSELDVLKQDVKILQQRIKRLEESGSKDRRLSTTLGLAHVARQPSPTIEEYIVSRHDASSDLSLFPATQALMSARLDGLLTPQSTTFERHDVVNRGNSSLQGLPMGIKSKTLPPQKSSNSRSGTPINGTASKSSRTLTGMRPPQISRQGLERKMVKQRGSATGNMATRCTASTLITDVTKTTIFPETKSTTQEASTGSNQNLEDPEYDDELVDDIRPQSSTESSTGISRLSASRPAHSRQDQTSDRAQRPPPSIQRRQSVAVAPPTPIPEPNNENKPALDRTTHDSKRRKTTAFDANTPSTSIGAADSRELRPGSGRRGEQRLLVRINGVEGKARKRPGEG